MQPRRPNDTYNVRARRCGAATQRLNLSDNLHASPGTLMRTLLAVLAMALIALAWANPDLDAFREYVEARSERFLLHETGDSAVGRALSGAGGALAGALAGHVAERRNYVVFSTYTLDFDSAEATEQEWRFVGVAGWFFETRRPEGLRGHR